MINITKSNCNYHLNRLYKEQERISERISYYRGIGNIHTVKKLKKEYHQNNNLIAQFIEFRRNHNCILEGDSGYGPL